MLWLEMSRDPVHGGGAWGFGQSLWSPAYTRQGHKSGYWENLLRVKAGDVVLHLRGREHEAAFVGFSTAADDGFETSDRPPHPGENWGFANRYYRVPLKDFTPFPDPILLDDVFQNENERLRDYFFRNKSLPANQKRRLFYVVQGGRLQCQNGAYLSEVDDELASIILGPNYFFSNIPQRPYVTARTAERITALRARVGQKAFSDNVRANYGSQCCFPNCDIAEDRFLIGSHIARWADNEELRGDTANGLCLCLMHDKAFEIGLFTIDSSFRVVVNFQHPALQSSPWSQKHLVPYHGHRIRLGNVLPSVQALREHWNRVRSDSFV